MDFSCKIGNLSRGWPLMDCSFPRVFRYNFWCFFQWNLCFLDFPVFNCYKNTLYRILNLRTSSFVSLVPFFVLSIAFKRRLVISQENPPNQNVNPKIKLASYFTLFWESLSRDRGPKRRKRGKKLFKSRSLYFHLFGFCFSLSRLPVERRLSYWFELVAVCRSIIKSIFYKCLGSFR